MFRLVTPSSLVLKVPAPAGMVGSSGASVSAVVEVLICTGPATSEDSETLPKISTVYTRNQKLPKVSNGMVNCVLRPLYTGLPGAKSSVVPM